MRQFFTDDHDRLSSIRLFAFVSLLVAIGVQAWGLFKGANVFEEVITWLSAAFCPKVVQKFAELRTKKG